MSEKVDLNPTYVQRNRRDVAIELIKFYIQSGNYTQDEITEDKLADLYKKYHQLAVDCDYQTHK